LRQYNLRRVRLRFFEKKRSILEALDESQTLKPRLLASRILPQLRQGACGTGSAGRSDEGWRCAGRCRNRGWAWIVANAEITREGRTRPIFIHRRRRGPPYSNPKRPIPSLRLSLGLNSVARESALACRWKTEPARLRGRRRSKQRPSSMARGIRIAHGPRRPDRSW